MILRRIFNQISPLLNKQRIYNHKILFAAGIPKRFPQIVKILDESSRSYFSIIRNLSSSNSQTKLIEVDDATYERVCSETLESLYEFFDELIESSEHLTSADVSYGDGVLTVNFGKKYGTYVINRQSPNKQIWLSSPTSGPKRYDFIIEQPPDEGKWIYKHTGESLHGLLQNEIKTIVKNNVDFFKLPYSKS